MDKEQPQGGIRDKLLTLKNSLTWLASKIASSNQAPTRSTALTDSGGARTGCWRPKSSLIRVDGTRSLGGQPI